MPSLGPPPGAKNSLCRSWKDLRSGCQWASAILHGQGREHGPSPTRHNVSTTVAQRHFHDLSLPIKPDPNIIASSLRETVEAHRKSNQDYLARLAKVKQRAPAPEAPASELKARSQKTRGKGSKFPIHQPSKHLLLRRGAHVHDYRGQVHWPRNQWKILPSLLPYARNPWMRQISFPKSSTPSSFANAAQSHAYAIDRLNTEIDAFESYLCPTKAEIAAGEAALADLNTILLTVDPRIKMHLVGSRNTGLSTPISDIDINISHPAVSNLVSYQSHRSFESRGRVLNLLGNVDKALRRPAAGNLHPDSSNDPNDTNLFNVSGFISGARVPILTGFHLPTQLKFQIQCTTEAFASMEYARAYVAEWPTLRPLFMVLKYMLEIRGLAAGSLGGVGSYPLLIMIVASLKLGEHDVRRRRNVGKDLLSFLEMYSEIDFYTTGISISPPEYFQKRRPRDSVKKSKEPEIASTPAAADAVLPSSSTTTQDARDAAKRYLSLLNPSAPYLMSLQDPSNPSHNLGAHANRIKHVQETFISVKSRLKQSMEDWESDSWDGREAEKKSFSVLDCCVGADYTIFEQERSHIKIWKKRKDANNILT